jgi:hypothetical protein
MLIRRLKTKGFNLLEMSCCFAIIAIISGGISQTLLNGVKMNLISGSEAAQQRVAVIFTRLLREDLRAASDVVVSGNGNILTITKSTGVVSYQYNASTSQVTRTVGTVTQAFPDSNEINSWGLKLSCDANCFELDAVSIPSQSFTNKKLSLNKITIRDSKTIVNPNAQGSQWNAYSFGPNKYKVASGSLFN